MFLTTRRYFATTLLLATVSGCSVGDTVSTGPETPNTITIGGSSEAYEMLEVLTEAYDQTVPTQFEFLPASQTSAGIEGTKANVMDIGAVSRPLTSSEIGEQLAYLPMVETPLILAVHDSVTDITNITTEDIQTIYSGEINNWKALGGPDQKIVLFDFTEDENEKIVLREAYLGDDLKITPDAVVFTEDEVLLETLSVTEFSVAAVPGEDELEDLPLVPLSIDGIQPSPANIQSGRYTMSLVLGLVTPAQPTPEVQAFIEFATSPEGQQALTDAEYVIASDSATAP